LLENLEREPPVEFHAGCSEKRPDGAGGAPLFANHLAEIAGGYAQFKDGNLLALNFADSDLFREIHKRFRNLFDEFLQLSSLWSWCGSRIVFEQPAHSVGWLRAVLQPI